MHNVSTRTVSNDVMDVIQWFLTQATAKETIDLCRISPKFDASSSAASTPENIQDTLLKQPKTSKLATMSKEYEGQDLQDIAKNAERDLASNSLKRGAQDGGFGGKTDKGGSTSSEYTSLHEVKTSYLHGSSS